MKESEFQKQVIQLAHLYRWLVVHFRPAQAPNGRWLTAVQGDGVGFPDLVLVKDEQVIFAELKVGKNQLTPAQQAWAKALGQLCHLWRPEDWNRIEAILSA